MNLPNSDQYDQMAEAYAKKNAEGPYNTFFERPSITRLLPNLDGICVLDLGCGSGSLAANLHRGGARVCGIDGSPAMLKIARRSLSPDVELTCADLNNGLPDFQSESFDLVVSSLTIHYLADFSQLAKEIRRVLRPGGRFVFSTHHPQMDFAQSKTKQYFSKERIDDEWDLGEFKQNVSFYRRPLADILRFFFEAGFVCEQLSEGFVSAELEQRFPEVAKRLSSKPQFLFVRLLAR
jgi:SAM-dependent methyltransferase